MVWPGDAEPDGERGRAYVSCVVWNTVMFDSVTPRTVAHQAPLPMGILHARIPEWVAKPSPRGSSQPRDWTQISHTVSFNVQLVNRPPNGSFTTGSFYQLYWQVIHQELLEGINQPVDLIVPSHPHFSPLSMPLTFGNRNHIMQFLTMVRRPWKVLPANCLKEMFKYL